MKDLLNDIFLSFYASSPDRKTQANNRNAAIKIYATKL